MIEGTFYHQSEANRHFRNCLPTGHMRDIAEKTWMTRSRRPDWRNGQTEGQVTRLKTLKRSMYGRAGAELLRARMLPIDSPIDDRV